VLARYPASDELLVEDSTLTPETASTNNPNLSTPGSALPAFVLLLPALYLVPNPRERAIPLQRVRGDVHGDFTSSTWIS